MDYLLISWVDLASEFAVVFVVAGDIVEVCYGYLLVVGLRGFLEYLRE